MASRQPPDPHLRYSQHEWQALLDATLMQPNPHPPQLPARTINPVHTLTARGPDAPAPIPVRDALASRPLARVLHARQSIRPENGHLTLDALGTVLTRTAPQRHATAQPDGIHTTTTPTPTAGGRTTHLLAVLANNVNGLPIGLWLYDPTTSDLRPAAHDTAHQDTANHAVRQALRTTHNPPAILFTVATPARLLGRYPRGLALLWRDAGALLATAHLNATDIGLTSSIAGTAGTLYPPVNDPTLPFDTGALALGAPDS